MFVTIKFDQDLLIFYILMNHDNIVSHIVLIIVIFKSYLKNNV